MLPDSDFSVAGVSLGMDSNEVIRALGPPPSHDPVYPPSRESHRRFLRERRTRDSLNGRATPPDSLSWHPLVFLYEGDGWRVIFVGDHKNVFAIDLFSRHYATRRGLRIGDPMTRVTQLYGPPVSSNGGS